MTSRATWATLPPTLTDNYQYIMNGVSYPLPCNLAGTNASQEMRTGFKKFLKVSQTSIFRGCPVGERDAMLREKLDKFLENIPHDPVIDKIFLVAKAGFIFM